MASLRRAVIAHRVAVRRAAALAVVGTLGSVVAFLARHLVRLRVEGVSMIPALAPGDRVLVWRTTLVKVGDVVAIMDPDERERVLIKRVTGFDAGSIRVEGDNPGASRDSRHFGPVPRRDVIGRVLTRYSSRFDRAAAARPPP